MRKILLALSSLLALVAVATAGAVYLGSRPDAGPCTGAAPAGLVSYRVSAADGNCLQGYVWAPPEPPVRAVVVVVHGIHDHARRYAGLAQVLNADGVAVLAQDHRGHGASGGAPQRIDSMEQVLADVQLALLEAGRRFPGAPVFVHGHSMGGLVAAQLAARGQAGLAGAIVSSAALKLPAAASASQIRIVKALSAVAPSLPLEAIDEGLVVREAAARDALAADPLIARAKVPARTVTTVLAGIVDIQPRMEAIRVPLLVLHGTADRVTEVDGSRELAARARAAEPTLTLVEGALHDLLHEPEGPQVAAAIAAFVQARTPPAAR